VNVARLGRLAPFAAHFARTSGGDENDIPPQGLPERRRYPPPELELGVIGAAKIAGILFVPLGVIATIFAVYLNGFESDLLLDVQRIVTFAIEKHTENERLTYGALADVMNLKEEVRRLREKDEQFEKQIARNTELLQRLAQKNGLR
jgi:hypothetical protein